MKYRVLHSILVSHGYNVSRMSKHIIYSNNKGGTIAVPHSRDIAVGTLRDIYKLLYPGNLGLANKQMRIALGAAA